MKLFQKAWPVNIINSEKEGLGYKDFLYCLYRLQTYKIKNEE